MGDPLSETGQRMDVTLSGGFAELFVQLDKTFNIARIKQSSLYEDLVGTYKIDVVGTYQGMYATITEKSYFLLTILPAKEEPEPEVIIIAPVVVEQPEEKTDAIIIEEWDGQVFLEEPEVELNARSAKNKDKPIPYIVSFEKTGLLQIGWTDEMQPPIDLAEIPPALVAVSVDEPLDVEDMVRRRRLEETETALF